MFFFDYYIHSSFVHTMCALETRIGWISIAKCMQACIRVCVCVCASLFFLSFFHSLSFAYDHAGAYINFDVDIFFFAYFVSINKYLFHEDRRCQNAVHINNSS